MTDSVCNRSFASDGKRSMRAARIACTVGGIFSSASGLVSFTVTLRTSEPSSSSTCTVSSMKKGVPSVFSMISRFSGASSVAIT